MQRKAEGAEETEEKQKSNATSSPAVELGCSHHHTLSAVLRLVGVLGLLDLADQQLKGLGHVRVEACTGLDLGAVKLLGQLLAVLDGDLALLGAQIALVADNHQGHPAHAKVVEYLITNDLDHLVRLFGSDGIDEDVAMDADKVLRVQDAILVLAGGVDDLGGIFLALVADLLAECVLDGRVVALDKVSLDVTDRQRGFACGMLVRGR